MYDFTVAEDFRRSLHLRRDWICLREALAEAASRMGFQYFAAIHHVDHATFSPGAFRLHNYPAALVARFDAEHRGASDPIHRASHRTANGFLWRDVGDLVRLTARDEAILREARAFGLGDGFTKPAHVPGEARGSISFAVKTGDVLPDEMIFCAQIVGDLAFEAARQIGRRRQAGPAQRVTDRQLECIIWVGRGKTDKEIASLLGVRRSTVIEHLRNARAAWDMTGRGVLPLRALIEGMLSLGDFFPGASPLVGMV